MNRKVMVLGVDGLDPRLTKKYVNKGLMPHLKSIIDQGAQREDLVMLGAMPTVTPPMWTTLATGAYPNTHGITDFYLQNKEHLDAMDYGLDSRFCKAEQIWNVTAESGIKTLVFHWPGSSWPPTSDSENLFVIDGTSPGSVAMSIAQVEEEYLIVADTKYEHPKFASKGAEGANTVCVITDLDIQDDSDFTRNAGSATGEIHHYIMKPKDGQMMVGEGNVDVALCPIREPKNWGFEVPMSAKEVVLVFSQGMITRPSLLLMNDHGVYDTLTVYKSKKENTVLYSLKKGEFQTNIIDESIKDNVRYKVNRNMHILDIAEDGSSLRMWVSAAMDTAVDTIYSPKYLKDEIVDNIGYPPPTSCMPPSCREFMLDCTGANWHAAADWQGKTINHLIENLQFEAVFSHFHNVDLQNHFYMRRLSTGYKDATAEDTVEALEDVYKQVDHYLSYFTHYLDEGWTILIVSDHALLSTPHSYHYLGDMLGVNVRVMQKLGYTVLKTDENGRELEEIDWTKTKAIANRAMDIWVNLKGRDEHGIVEPEDKYELEEQIITDLYNYKDDETGKRVVALALHNKDAAVLGLGGPDYGDIIYFVTEGYNFDHGDSLSTFYGEHDTSVSPIFIAAGAGLKKGFKTDRVIREVDIAPTVATLLGVRMPAQCEGAPVYQIFDK